MGEYLKVSYRQTKNCFCQITGTVLFTQWRRTSVGKNLVNVVVTTTDGGQIYLTADSVESHSSHYEPGKLSLSPAYVSCLPIKEGDKVYVAFIGTEFPSCETAVMRPIKADDYAIMVENGEDMASIVLNQIRLVWTGQVIPIALTDTVTVYGRVGVTNPKGIGCLRLDNNSRIFVSTEEKGDAKVAHSQQSSSTASVHHQPHSITKQLKQYITTAVEKTFGSKSDKKETSEVPIAPEPYQPLVKPLVQQWPVFDSATPIISRVYTMSSAEYTGKWRNYPSICIISKDLVSKSIPSTFLADMTLLMSPAEIEDDGNKHKRLGTPALSRVDKHIGTVCVVVEGRDDTTPTVQPGHVRLSKSFCSKLPITSKVKLEKVKSEEMLIKKIVIQPKEDISSSDEVRDGEFILSTFKKHIRSAEIPNDCPMVLHRSSVINMEFRDGTKADFLLLIEPTTPCDPNPVVKPHLLLTNELMEDITLDAHTNIPTKVCPVPSVMSWIDEMGVIKPVGFQEIYAKSLGFVGSSLACRTEGGLLITGPRGSGKTRLAEYISSEMYRTQQCYIHKLDGKQLKGKRAEMLRKDFDKAIKECVWRQPSILYLEDLDSLCRAPSGPEEETSADILNSIKVAEVLKDRLDDLWRSNPECRDQVVVMVTSISRNSLHEKLTPTHGVHVFHLTVEIPGLDQDSRHEVLKAVAESAGVTTTPSDHELLTLCDRLDGYVAQDLVSLVRRASHAHTIETAENPVTTLTVNDFTGALHEFTPASLRGVTLHSPGDNTWEDIGGLHNIKDQLIRMLEWPTKYRKLYVQCPIRLQSGVLLYGAPGTGKTLIAAVVAREMGLNFISIKGPELLNKYIGSSEQGVRDTFARAQSARPCILFFDEFESLAPRRGHDSTGVTDRVVNQLLTQLDGVEALEGVYVLAATSRPDLIDPALLRPGRLDKSLSCDIPSEGDRVEILNALSRKMCIDDDADLDSIARRCDHCTGADIKSLLVNAQLEAVHDIMSKPLDHAENKVQSGDGVNDDQVKGFYKSADREDFQPIAPSSQCYEKVRKLSSRLSNQSQNKRKTGVTRQQSSRSSANKVVITKAHMETALAALQPSVSETERKKYKYIYEQFTGSKTDQSAVTLEQQTASKQRVSLM